MIFALEMMNKFQQRLQIDSCYVCDTVVIRTTNLNFVQDKCGGKLFSTTHDGPDAEDQVCNHTSEVYSRAINCRGKNCRSLHVRCFKTVVKVPEPWVKPSSIASIYSLHG